MNYIIWVFLVMFATGTSAKVIVDVHGVDEKSAQNLLQKYSAQIQNLEARIMEELLQLERGYPHLKQYQCLMYKKKQLMTRIQKENGFGCVDVQTVFYYENETLYSTLEVLESPQAGIAGLSNAENGMTRFRIWRDRVYRKIWKQQDVINQMQQFEALVTQLSLTHQLERYGNDCPVYHCLAAFYHPQLQPYEAIFQHGVAHDKTKIIATLQTDPDPQRRAAAALLIGHFSDPQEIVTLLNGSIQDTASQVRNNALRVILFTLYKSQRKDIESQPYLSLLESPFVTDRNKALAILIVLADNPAQTTKIIQRGGESIVNLLQLTQPDNHDLAYILLKKLSYHSFGETDYAQWKKWLRSGQDHAL